MRLLCSPLLRLLRSNCKILTVRFQKADAQNRLTYLESSAHSNIEYYKKFDFITKCDIVLNRGSTPIKLHIMVRYPRSSRSLKDEASSGSKTVVMSASGTAPTASKATSAADLVEGKKLGKSLA